MRLSPLTARRRTGALLIGLGLLFGSVTGGVLAGRERARSRQDAGLVAEVGVQRAAFGDFAARISDVALLLAQNAALRDFLSVRSEADHLDAIEDVQAALGFVERLYPGRLAEVSFVGSSGEEHARVVGGIVASADELSADQSGEEFFARTLQLRPGEVYHSDPHPSKRVGEWVLTYSTPVVDDDDRVRGLVHFELSIDGLRHQATAHAGERNVMLVDASNGDVIVDTARSGIRSVPDLADRRFDALMTTSPSEGLATVAGNRVAFKRLVTGPKAINDWYVVVSDRAHGGWFGQWTAWQVALSAIAVLLSALWVWGMWMDSRRLQRAAETDALTGLPNRAYLHRTIGELLQDRDDDHLGAVMMLDLDRFKDVNDTLGHHQGDVLLSIVSERLRRCVRPSDVVARLGGDEFGVLLRRIDSPTDAMTVARRIRDELGLPFGLGDVTIQIGGSVGVALIPEHGVDVHLLLQRADVAMYDAKTSGRGWTMYQAERDPYGDNHLAFVNDLRTAIDIGGNIDRAEPTEFPAAAGAIEVHYQPIVDLISGEVQAVEALVRWRHPHRGMLDPSAFVPIAERSGLIREMTTTVVRRAMHDALRWHAAGLDVGVAINLAGVSLRDTWVVEEIAELLGDVARPLIRITVEITESAMLIERERAKECLDRLRAIGVRVALDDFGTGYASLIHLKELSVDTLKIDHQFVAAIGTSEIDEVIVQSTIALGRSLRMEVIAEGIERVDTLDRLVAWGCTMGQGYLIARPMPIDDLLVWLQTAARDGLTGWPRPPVRAPVGSIAPGGGD